MLFLNQWNREKCLKKEHVGLKGQSWEHSRSLAVEEDIFLTLLLTVSSLPFLKTSKHRKTSQINDDLMIILVMK